MLIYELDAGIVVEVAVAVAVTAAAGALADEEGVPDVFCA